MDGAIAAAEAHQVTLAGLTTGDQHPAEKALTGQIDRGPVRESRHAALRSLGDSLVDVSAQPSGTPDYRGAVELALAEALGRAVASGDDAAMDIAFPKLLAHALRAAEGDDSASGNESDRRSDSAPLVAAIALTGLALAYEDLGVDAGAGAAREAWRNAGTRARPARRQAQAGLDALDEEARSGLSMQAWRWSGLVAEWQESLTKAIADHGFAYGGARLGPTQSPQDAPPQIRILGAPPPPFSGCAVTPEELAGGRILAPLSGETGDLLRARPALQDYFEAIDTV